MALNFCDSPTSPTPSTSSEEEDIVPARPNADPRLARVLQELMCEAEEKEYHRRDAAEAVARVGVLEARLRAREAELRDSAERTKGLELLLAQEQGRRYQSEANAARLEACLERHLERCAAARSPPVASVPPYYRNP